MRYPHILKSAAYRAEETDDDRLPPLPPDLATALGPELVQACRDLLADDGMIHNSDAWWSAGLPACLGLLHARVKDRDALLDGLRKFWDDRSVKDEQRIDQMREDCNVEKNQLLEEIGELEGRVQELEGSLREAKGREDALHAVIQRCRWG